MTAVDVEAVDFDGTAVDVDVEEVDFDDTVAFFVRFEDDISYFYSFCSKFSHHMKVLLTGGSEETHAVVVDGRTFGVASQSINDACRGDRARIPMERARKDD
jgi:hypothetical protein